MECMSLCRLLFVSRAVGGYLIFCSLNYERSTKLSGIFYPPCLPLCSGGKVLHIMNICICPLVQKRTHLN